MGGGIAGLAVASGLQGAGWEVLVLERSSDPEPPRSGLSLFGNGFRALDCLGLGPAVRAICADSPPYAESGIKTPSGRWLTKFAPSSSVNLRAVDRTELHAVLLASVTPGTVRWGQRATSVVDGSVVLQDGAPLTGHDLIVGADGIRSRVRASLPQDRGTRRCGYGAWRAITAEPVPIGAGGETWGAGERFGIVPLRDGRVYWFAVVNSAHHQTDVDDLKQVQARFGSWHDPINALIEATKSGDVSYLPIEELARPLSSYAHDHTVLIGDAAHAMTPNLGQGANQALEDAATLAVLLTRQSLSSEDDLRIALRQYDRLRRSRTQRVARESRVIGVAAQWTFPPAVRLRDRALSATPNWIFSRRTTRLQQWSPPARSARTPVRRTSKRLSR